MLLPIVVRYSVYGEFVPNTFFAKSDLTVRNGVGFLLGSVNEMGPLVWLTALVGVWNSRKRCGWLAGVVACFGVYFIAVGGDILIHRFVLFWYPFLWVGFAWGVDCALPLLGAAARVVALSTAILLGAQELYRAYRVVKPTGQPEGYGYVSSSAISTVETDALIGRYLAKEGRPGDVVITDNIGAIGYYSGMRLIDVNGLTDGVVAKSIRRSDWDAVAKYVREKRATWIVCYPSRGTSSTYEFNRVGLLGEWVEKDYSAIGTWRSRTGYTRVLLQRTDLESSR